jgi:hypothetical protein
MRCNNRVEQAHQPTRVRERVMRRFKAVASAQRFLEAFSRVGNLFRPRRHLLRAAAYRAVMRERAGDGSTLRLAPRRDHCRRVLSRSIHQHPVDGYRTLDRYLVPRCWTDASADRALPDSPTRSVRNQIPAKPRA